MKTLNASVYEVPEVAQACEKAQRRADDSGEDWAVYVDPKCPARTWTTPSGEPCPGECVFDTADGGKLL
jgi:hypothetical protein